MVFEQLGEAGERWMQAELVVDLLEILRRNSQGLAELGIAVVGVRHDGVQAVVAAGELHDDEHGFLAPGLPVAGAAAAVRLKNSGAVWPQATTPAASDEFARNVRRFCMSELRSKRTGTKCRGFNGSQFS